MDSIKYPWIYHCNVYCFKTVISSYVQWSEYCDLILTQTGDSSIFRVGTVVNANPITGAVHKSGFSTNTLHVVQKDVTSSLAKEGTTVSSCTCDEITINCIVNCFWAHLNETKARVNPRNTDGKI